MMKKKLWAFLSTLVCIAGCIPTAAGSMLPHIKNNRIEWRTALPAAVSGCILAYLTASFLRGFDAGLLKRFFGLFLIYIGIREVTAKK